MDLVRLEEKRNGLIKEIGQLKEMRRGSVTEQFLSVKQKGRKNPVLRGPYYVHTTKIGGRTVSQRLGLDKLEKYQREIDNFHHFQGLIKRLIETNEQITDLRPVANQDTSESKKKLSRQFRRKLPGRPTS